MKSFFGLVIVAVLFTGCGSDISIIDAYESNGGTYVVHKESLTTYTVTPVDGSDAPGVIDDLRTKGYSVDVYSKNRIYEELR